MQNEKEQEMSPANPTVATPSSQRDLVHSLEILDTEFNSQPIGKHQFQYFFSFMPLFISHHGVHVLFHDTVLCVLLCVSQWNGPVSRTTKWKWVWQTVELPLSGTINTFFSLFMSLFNHLRILMGGKWKKKNKWLGNIYNCSALLYLNSTFNFKMQLEIYYTCQENASARPSLVIWRL